MNPLRTEDVPVQNIKLIRLVPDAERDLEAAAPHGIRAYLGNLLFLVMVVLPAIAAIVYFFLVAAPRYQSEVKFVVRSPGSATTSALASLVSGSSITRSGDDAFIAKEYMLSQDAMRELIRQDKLQAMFDKGGIDLLWRYPLPFRKANTEGLKKHYLKFVNVEYDQSTGISSLGFQAFDPLTRSASRTRFWPTRRCSSTA